MSKLPRIVRGERQKELARIFDAACERHNRWTVWSDFMCMFAIAISNAVDKAQAPEREQMYMNMVSKYNSRETDCLSRMFALIVEAIDENPDQDFLGDLYMAFELGNNQNGQFFTPYSLCAMTAKLEEDIPGKVAEKDWISVNDPACGAGALLLAFANECKAQGVNYQTSVLFVAQDVDFVTACMCYIQLSLLGCPGYVVVGNTISNPATSMDSRGLIPAPGQNIWYTPMYFRDIWQTRRVLAGMKLIGQRKHPRKPDPPRPEIKTTESGQLSLF